MSVQKRKSDILVQLRSLGKDAMLVAVSPSPQSLDAAAPLLFNLQAAPELLAALKGLTEALALDRLEDGGQVISEAYGEAFREARAAIAFAEGPPEGWR